MTIEAFCFTLLIYFFFTQNQPIYGSFPFIVIAYKPLLEGINKDNECVHEDKFLSTYIEPYKSKINVPSC
jgi:hypothetical protein